MTEQTKAQRLADWLDNSDCNFYGESSMWFDNKLAEKVGEAADELRRLDALNAELVEAVEAALSDDQPYIEKCRAALAKAKEQT